MQMIPSVSQYQMDGSTIRQVLFILELNHLNSSMTFTNCVVVFPMCYLELQVVKSRKLISDMIINVLLPASQTRISCISFTHIFHHISAYMEKSAKNGRQTPAASRSAFFTVVCHVQCFIRHLFRLLLNNSCLDGGGRYSVLHRVQPGGPNGAEAHKHL